MGPAIKGLGSAGAQGNTVSIDWIVWIVGEKWRLYEGVLKQLQANLPTLRRQVYARSAG